MSHICSRQLQQAAFLHSYFASVLTLFSWVIFYLLILKKLTFLKKFFPEHYRECHTVWISAVFSCWVIFLSVDFKKINILKKFFPEHYRERHTVWISAASGYTLGPQFTKNISRRCKIANSS